MALNLSRNTRVWVSTVNTGGVEHDNTNTWEVGVQDGYSYSQSMTSTDITVDEAGPAPVRGSKRFNDALDPVDWSFTTYVRPFKLPASHAEAELQGRFQLVDGLLWHSLASGSTPDLIDSDANQSPPIYGEKSDGTNTKSFVVKFTDNSYHQLTKLYIFLKVDNSIFRIDNAQVNTVDLSVDIADITQTNWSGQGTDLVLLEAAPAFMAHAGLDIVTATGGIVENSYVRIPVTADYLINKYTIMDLTSSISGSSVIYSVPITGATLTISNNITFLTPSTLGKVDTPIGSFTGTFEVSGSIECYMNDKLNGSRDLFKHLAASRAVTNASNIVFHIGGKLSTPRIEIAIPAAHLTVPELSIDDVISQSMEFKGIPATNDMNDGLEVNFKFIAS